MALLWGTLIPSRKGRSLKFTGELCVMTMKKDAKFEKELTSSKLTWGTQQILTRAFENLKNLLFNGLHLTKIYNASAWKVQKSYVWCHSRLIKKLKENWFAVSEMTRIRRILIWALKSLKNLSFDWYLTVMLDLKK